MIPILDPKLLCIRPESFTLVSRPSLNSPPAIISQVPTWSDRSAPAMAGMMSSSFAFTHAIKTSSYWDTRAPIRSLSDSATSEKVEDGAEKKPKYKGKTLFDIVAYLDNFGVGWRYRL
jgi:hypothetical protein